MTHSPIGLDVGTAWIKAAQWRRGARGWALRAAAWPRRAPGADLPPDEASRLAAVLGRRGFSGDLVALLAPAQRARVAEIDLPAGASGHARNAAARMELARVCRLDPGAFEFALWDLPRSARPGESAAAAAVLPHADADAFVEPLQAAGLAVASIVPQSLALRNLLGATPESGIDAVIDLGASALSLTVLVGGLCVYERRLPELSTTALAAAVASTTRLSPDQAERVVQGAVAGSARLADALASVLRSFGGKIGDEIAVSLEYASHRYPRAAEGRMVAVGGGACHPAMLTAAGQALGLDVLPAPAVPLPEHDLAPPWSVIATAAMAVAPPQRTGGAA